jgi:CubicO group peptidase (beta-lactamase class C family)
MTTNPFVPVALLTFLSLVSVVAAQPSSPDVKASRVPEDRFAAIPKRMEQFVADNRISGAVTLVAQKGEIVHLSAVGKANLAEDKPMNDDSVFRIMSMTKPMTATAVMMLADEGKLSLDDPVEKHIPSFVNAMLRNGTQVRNLTIRRLLTHTSGLTGDQNCPYSLEATAEMLAQRSFEFQPGEKWQYGPSFNVLGRIIEVASGKKYQDFMAERIFKPLEMNDTTFFPNSQLISRLAVVYKPGPAGGPAMVPPWRLRAANLDEKVPNPSGGLFAAARDVFRFYQTILDGGEWKGAPGGPKRILSAAAVKEMTSVQTGELPTNWGTSNSWGLGWCLINRPRGASGGLNPGSFGHGGLYGTQVWVDPSKQAVFILMIQSIDFEDSDSSTVRREFQRLTAEALDMAKIPGP